MHKLVPLRAQIWRQLHTLDPFRKHEDTDSDRISNGDNSSTLWTHFRTKHDDGYTFCVYDFCNFTTVTYFSPHRGANVRTVTHFWTCLFRFFPYTEPVRAGILYVRKRFVQALYLFGTGACRHCAYTEPVRADIVPIRTLLDDDDDDDDDGTCF